MNTPESHVMCLLYSLMTSLLTHRKSRQLNFSLHIKINHIEFKGKFLIKTHESVKYFLSVDC